MEIGAEKINPYDNNRSKTEQVQEMFDSIAPAYDFMNRAMTFGIDHLWRAKAVKMMGRNKPANILDVATGTGDLAIRIARTLHPDHITGIDLSDGMLEIGRKKAKEAGLDGIVCSPLEAGKVHALCGKQFLTITPGVRFADGDVGDQKRVMTPAQAKEIGSDYIVVGRPITAAADPVAAYERCVAEFCD